MVGEQLVDACGRVSLHAQEDILEVRERVDAMPLGGLHERVEDGEVACGLLVTEEERIRPREGDDSEGGFAGVVARGVWFNSGARFFLGEPRPTLSLGFVSLDPTELREAARRMARGLADLRR